MGLVFSAGGAPTELAVWRELLSQFEQQSGIPVMLQELPADSDQQHTYYTTLLGSSSSAVDVMRLDIVWLPEFIGAGWLAPLDAATVDADWLQACAEVDSADEAWYAAPWNIDVGLLYYRQDLLAAAGITGSPQTWDELAAAIRRVRELQDAPEQGLLFQGRQYEGLTCVYLEQVASRGGSLDPRQELNSAVHLAALKYLSGLIADGLSPRDTPSALDEERAREIFQRGGAVFMRNWPYAWSLLNAADSPVAGKVAVAPLPHGLGGRSCGAMGGWHLAVAAKSKRSTDAQRLIAFLTSPAVQVQLAQQLSWLPSRHSAWDDAQLAARAPQVAQLRAAAESAIPRPVHARYPELSLEVQRIVNRVLAGLATPEEGWRELSARLERFK